MSGSEKSPEKYRYVLFWNGRGKESVPSNSSFTFMGGSVGSYMTALKFATVAESVTESFAVYLVSTVMVLFVPKLYRGERPLTKTVSCCPDVPVRSLMAAWSEIELLTVS